MTLLLATFRLPATSYYWDAKMRRILKQDFEYSENLMVIDSTELNTITTLNDRDIILPSETALCR